MNAGNVIPMLSTSFYVLLSFGSAQQQLEWLSKRALFSV